MKQASTLIDTLYRVTFNKDTMFGWKSNLVMRDKFVAARRFVLDEAMSTFLGELATRAFAFKNKELNRLKLTDVSSAQRRLHVKRLEALRTSAMAPHAVTWIEYKLRPAMARTFELWGTTGIPSDERPEIEGWLIEQHPQMDTAFSMHLFAWNTKLEEQDKAGFRLWTFPVMYGWTIDDNVPPWPSFSDNSSVLATGINGYKVPQVTITASPILMSPTFFPANIITNLITEWTGVLRRVWALLACIDDIPVTRGTVQASKGFVARGRYRRFLDHHTITISVPHKQQARLAAQAVAGAVKRRGHGVRAHWRINHWFPPSAQCPSFLATGVHAWTAEQECSDCHGRRSKIPEHRRGDASQGLMVTDYVVTHDP